MIQVFFAVAQCCPWFGRFRTDLQSEPALLTRRRCRRTFWHGWAYLLAANTLHSVFLANLLAGFCAALYAEILARCCNAPSTPFFITAAIPLIPGSTLYYCMNAVVSNDLSAAEHFGEQTFLAALGIAGGMAIAWCLADLSRKLHALAIRSSGK